MDALKRQRYRNWEGAYEHNQPQKGKDALLQVSEPLAAPRYFLLLAYCYAATNPSIFFLDIFS